MDYKNAKIYKLVNDELNLTYYGSTCTALHKRLYQHKHKSNRCSSKIMFESGEVKIYLVELFPTENKILLTQRERYYIENNDCINKKIPNRTKKEYDKEYYIDNKEKFRVKNKNNYENNKDKISKRKKEKYKQKKILENNKRFLEEI